MISENSCLWCFGHQLNKGAGIKANSEGLQKGFRHLVPRKKLFKMFGWSRFRCEQKVVSLLWLAHMSIFSQVSLREPSWRVVVSRTFYWGDIGIQQINEGRTRTCEITGPSWSSRSNHPTEKGWTFTQQMFSNFYRDGKVTRLQLPDVCGWLYCVPHEDLETKSKHVLWDRTDKHRFPHEMNWNEPWVKSRALQILEKSICHPYKPSNHWNGGWPLLVGLQNVNKIHIENLCEQFHHYPNPPPVEVPYQPKVWSPKALPPRCFFPTKSFNEDRNLRIWLENTSVFLPWKRKTTEKTWKKQLILCLFTNKTTELRNFDFSGGWVNGFLGACPMKTVHPWSKLYKRFLSTVISCTPQKKLGWQWKITSFRKRWYIFKGLVFHCHLSFQGSKSDMFVVWRLWCNPQTSKIHISMTPTLADSQKVIYPINPKNLHFASKKLRKIQSTITILRVIGFTKKSSIQVTKKWQLDHQDF